MDAVPFQIESESVGDNLRVIGVHGELDLGTAPEFEAALADATADPDARVVVDMAGCGFVDSTGIALIINAWRRVEGADDAAGRMVLCNVGEQVARLFEVTGLTGQIDIADDRDAAVGIAGS